MAKYVLASVGELSLFNQGDGSLILTSKTLTESGISFSVSEQEVRGGALNGLLASYYTDSAMNLTIQDALFSMETVALNTGSSIQMSADVMGIETITVTEANKVTVSQTPQKFGEIGVIGWVSVAGKDEWSKIAFDPSTKTANVADAPIGTTLCVKYIKKDASAEQITVSSAFIPAQCTALLTLPLFKCSESGNATSNSSKVGEVQVEIPNFQLSGAMELSLTSSGNATVPLSGKALMTFGGNTTCENAEGYYARLKQIVYGQDEFGDIKNLVIADSSVELGVGEKQILEVYAIYGGIKAPKKIENSKLTFTTSADSIATVNEDGEVEGVAEGTANIEVVVTSKPSLIAKAVVEIS